MKVELTLLELNDLYRVAGHVEVLLPRKTAEKKLTANDERFALAA